MTTNINDATLLKEWQCCIIFTDGDVPEITMLELHRDCTVFSIIMLQVHTCTILKLHFFISPSPLLTALYCRA